MKQKYKFVISEDDQLRVYKNGLELQPETAINELLDEYILQNKSYCTKNTISRRKQKFIDGVNNKLNREEKETHIIFTKKSNISRLKPEEQEWVKHFDIYGKSATIAQIMIDIKSMDYQIAKRYLENAIKVREIDER